MAPKYTYGRFNKLEDGSIDLETRTLWTAVRNWNHVDEPKSLPPYPSTSDDNGWYVNSPRWGIYGVTEDGEEHFVYVSGDPEIRTSYVWYYWDNGTRVYVDWVYPICIVGYLGQYPMTNDNCKTDFCKKLT